MRDCTGMLVKPNTTLHQTIQIIEKDAAQIALVVDSCSRLLGTVTDGDVRRAILQGVNIHQAVGSIMNNDPKAVPQGASRQAVWDLMVRQGLRRIPVIDEHRIVIGIEALEDFLQPPKRDNWVVIMAGGLGSRLAPLTEDCPKPLLKVGPKPILEIILDSLIAHSFRNFYFSVNYKAEMIESYFENGSRWGVNIRYLREKQRLGTAGALSLLPFTPKQPIIIVNGDLLTRVDFGHLLQVHHATGSTATMCISEYTQTIPYGIVRIEGNRFLGIKEKPVQQHFVNAGIYVVEPQVLSQIPSDTYTDMPLLFEQLAGQNKSVNVFPVRDYWLDIGHIEDYERANRDYDEVFP
ncbi:CBS domain-containing protein [Paenibacillus sp. 1_12]|uniref:nucleotidyltransferase family protein n=1 Tax=Paenibacillus sp. 1_12 TaxID=1566278 RepID=UPI0008F078E9|nr:nucleotidyltransferase family protein [Paenibacillus sp. 1_12]SFK81362.1 CBS domain-containing protein [Paenibacillus sp. 1_12]